MKQIKLISAFLAISALFIVAISGKAWAQATFNLETGTGTGAGWTWQDPVLIINDGADVIITGHVDNERRIEIATNANASITLSNVSIAGLDEFQSPLQLHLGSTLNLTIEGDNMLLAGEYCAGIQATASTTLTIDGTGNLTATGKWSCSGIGGGLWDNGPCGTITINGGVITAKGGGSSWIGTGGAGIGGGAAEPSGDITINGGTVIANDGAGGAGMGIGNGGGDSVGTLTITGNAIIFTNSAGDMNLDNKTGGILVVGNATHWYGGDDFTLDYNVTVPNTNLLTIDEGKTITIPAGMTLTNNGAILNYSGITINGTLINNGTIINANAGTITGTVSGTAPTTVVPFGNNIDLSEGSPLRIGEGWVFANNVCTVLDGADVVITGSVTGQKRVEVAANSLANMTLNNVSITGLGNDRTPLLINAGAEVNLTLEGNNVLKAGRSRAGLQAAETTTLTIDGTGSLTVEGGAYGGAAIGGAFREGCGKITINGGTITANAVESGSYFGGAGIGGGGAGIIFFSFAGIGGTGGDITINGGTVTANGNTGGAGIGGGGEAANSGTLTMNGNAVVFVSALINSVNAQTDLNGVVRGILFDGYEGSCYGAVAITDDVELPQNYTLHIPAVASFTIPENRTFTFNGAINNDGTMRDDGGILILNGTLTGNKILFSNTGGEIVTVPYSSTPIDVAYLFKTNANTGAPSFTIEEGSTGEGTIEEATLTVTESGTFIIGLITAETYYYVESEKVTSTLIVEPPTGIESLSSPSLVAWIGNDMLHVNGLKEGEVWNVYNILGKLVYRGVATDSTATIPLKASGMFIIQSEQGTAKVIRY